MKRFLVSTEHLEDKLWFRDDDDFKVGMNFVALCAFKAGVRIIAFILMSNHVHFVLEGTEEAVLKFINLFKSMYSRYLTCRYKAVETLRSNGVDIREISNEGESLERTIAYVVMNPVAANICFHPSMYSWGSGACYFNPTAEKGKSIFELSLRARQRILHSRCALDEHYLIGREGYILPISYIPVDRVEALYRTPNRFIFFLNSSSRAKIRLEGDALPSFRDQIILAAVQDICQSLFRKSELNELDELQKPVLMKELRRRFSADTAQLARVTGMSYANIAKMLDCI